MNVSSGSPRLRLALLFLAGAALPAGLAAQSTRPSRDVIVATTTSLFDTGLLDSLAPAFARATGFRVRAVVVGSGQALRLGERGDADVVLAHSPAAESAFVAAGHGPRRRLFAWNAFVLIGPPDDPAGARQAHSAADALRRIAAAHAVFVSRADSSGTHQRELALWREAGGRPPWTGYVETGQGMALTLLVAGERRGYALADISTYLTLRGRVELDAMREDDPSLRNFYHVIEVNAATRPRVNAAGARAFADFLLSPEAQATIGRFGELRFGRPLFRPASGVLP